MKKTNYDMEQRVLLAILSTPDRRVRNYLLANASLEHFGVPEGRTIRKRMAFLLSRRRSDFGDLETFREHGAIGDQAKTFLTPDRKSIIRKAEATTLKQAKHMVSVLQDYRKHRILIEGAEKLVETCKGEREEHEDKDTLAEAENTLQDMLTQLRGTRDKELAHLGVGRTKEAIRQDIKRLTRRRKRDFVSTGIDILDQRIQGYERGDLVIMTAPTSGGKTTLALQMMVNQFLLGFSIGYVSLEMDKDQLYRRLLACATKSDIGHIRTGIRDRQERRSLYQAWLEFEFRTAAKYKNRLTLWDVKDPNYTPQNLELDLSPFNYDIIYVDYISLLGAGRKEQWAAQRDHSRYLKQAGGRMGQRGCVMAALTQMNEEEKVKYGTGPQEDADWWLSWKPDEEEMAKNQIGIRLRKARHGRSGLIINAQLDLTHMRVNPIGIARPDSPDVTSRQAPDTMAKLDFDVDHPPAAKSDHKRKGKKFHAKASGKAYGRRKRGPDRDRPKGSKRRLGAKKGSGRGRKGKGSDFDELLGGEAAAHSPGQSKRKEGKW